MRSFQPHFGTFGFLNVLFKGFIRLFYICLLNLELDGQLKEKPIIKIL